MKRAGHARRAIEQDRHVTTTDGSGMRGPSAAAPQMFLHLWRRNGSLVNRALAGYVSRAGGQEQTPRDLHHRVLVSRFARQRSGAFGSRHHVLCQT